MYETLRWLGKLEPLRNLVEVCFGNKEPSFAPPATLPKAFNDNLDPSQKLAVAKAQSAVEVALIHGPPGTGKSTTLMEIILQAQASGKKVSGLIDTDSPENSVYFCHPWSPFVLCAKFVLFPVTICVACTTCVVSCFFLIFFFSLGTV
jgi:hypothetical protein